MMMMGWMMNLMTDLKVIDLVTMTHTYCYVLAHIQLVLKFVAGPPRGVHLECDDENVNTIAALELAVAQVRHRVITLDSHHDDDEDNSSDDPESASRHMIKTPSGNWISKSSAVVMLRELWINAGKKPLSADRLKRIEQCARTMQEYRDSVEEHGGDYL